MRELSTITLLLHILIACDTSPFYNESKKVSQFQWNRNDIKSFIVNVDDNEAKYTVYFTLRHLTGYPYANLHVKLSNILPDGKKLEKDYELQIQNKEKGYLGNGMGDYWDYEILLEDTVQFESKGKYQFDLSHGMNANPVNFVSQVGLKIKKHK